LIQTLAQCTLNKPATACMFVWLSSSGYFTRFETKQRVGGNYQPAFYFVKQIG